jgi:hypothetical protein
MGGLLVIFIASLRIKKRSTIYRCSSVVAAALLPLQDLLGLLQLGKLAFFAGEFRTHPGDFLFLLADLLKDDLDGVFLTQGLRVVAAGALVVVGAFAGTAIRVVILPPVRLGVEFGKGSSLPRWLSKS